jgi:Raf kinase inhibitor-like YbhB/YbcL family protein
MTAITVWSEAFRTGETIPTKYTCNGRDMSLPISWTNIPSDTRSIALIMDDPDASGGVFTHWVAFNIHPNIRILPEGIPKSSSLTPWPFGDSSYQGINDFGNIGYGGPCPPPGKSHRYVFKVYALDAKLPLPPGSTKLDVENAMVNHILAKGELIGTYNR